MKKYNPFGYDEFAPVVGVTGAANAKGQVCSVCGNRNPAGKTVCVFCGNEMASDGEIAEMLRNLRRKKAEPVQVEEAAISEEPVAVEEAVETAPVEEPIEEETAAEPAPSPEEEKQELMRLINDTVAEAVSRAVPTPAVYAEEAKKAVEAVQESMRAENAEYAARQQANAFDAEKFRRELSADFA